MTRYELERHLGKYVEIVLFDGTVIDLKSNMDRFIALT